MVIAIETKVELKGAIMLELKAGKNNAIPCRLLTYSTRWRRYMLRHQSVRTTQ